MRKFNIMVIIIVSFLVLCGCNKNGVQPTEKDNPVKETVKLTVWGSDMDQGLLNEMVESFKVEHKDEAEFEITVEVGNEDSCKERILEDVGAAADVFAFADDQLMELVAAGVLEALEDDERIKAENSVGSVAAASINDEVYAYPMTADNGYFLYYNKKYLSEQEVGSFDQILKVANNSNKKVVMDVTSGWYLYSFFGNTGLELGLNSDGITNHCNWNSTSEKIKGVDVGNAILNITSNPAYKNGGDADFIEGAKNGTIIAGISGIWSAEGLSEVWGSDFAATKMPTYTVAGDQVQMSSYEGYKMIGVNAYSKEKEWAHQLADWLTNEQNQVLRFEKRGLAPSNKVAASTEKIKQSPAIQALTAQSEYAKLQRVGAKYWGPAHQFGQALIDGKVSSRDMQQHMDTMVKEINQKITE